MNQTQQSMATLTAENISFSIDGRHILRDISVEFTGRGMTAIVGVNGAGKSTLLRILAGIAQPSLGGVRIDGTSLSRLTAKQRTRRLSYVAQDEVPPAEMTVADFVSLGRLPYQGIFGRSTENDQRIVGSSLEQVGLVGLQNRSCSDLSGGQRRGVVLARGLAQTAPLLLLDEPTNHLDVAHQQRMLRLARQSGSCVVAAVHDLDLVMSFFDRVLVLHDATIYADGNPEDVLNEHTLAEVFKVRSAQVSSSSSRRMHVVIEGELGR